MTVARNSPPSEGGTTVDFVGRSSVVDAAIRKSLENSWAIQGISEPALTAVK